MSKINNKNVGVWIGENIEIIRTRKFEIIYRKFENNDCVFLDSILYYFNAQGKNYLGRVLLDLNKIEISYYLKKRRGNKIHNEYIFEQWNSNIPREDKGFDEDNYQNQRDKLYIKYSESNKYKLLKEENITISNKVIRLPKLSDTTMTVALKKWAMGSNVGTDNQTLTINTKKHMYIFQITDSYIYCRAARYASSEKGVVFAQNFRISARNGKITSGKMVTNNYSSMEPIDIDSSLFDPKKCTMQSKWWQGIYWSINNKSDELIKLNGCNGDIYDWPRLTDKEEWFIY